jgi:hypothetical protein
MSRTRLDKSLSWMETLGKNGCVHTRLGDVLVLFVFKKSVGLYFYQIDVAGAMLRSSQQFSSQEAAKHAAIEHARDLLTVALRQANSPQVIK